MLLDRKRILDFLGEVADELGDLGPTHTIIVAGGAMLTIQGLRDATRDVDSIEPIDDELVRIVAVVAKRHDGLAPSWLNAHAAAWRPNGFDPDSCELIFERQRLRVLGVSPRVMFLMKLEAVRARTRDREDLVQLWTHAGFTNPEEAVAAYWVAYPGSSPDPHLVKYVADVQMEATDSSPIGSDRETP